LPFERIDGEKAFKSTGVDHLGPLYIRDVFEGEELRKAWIVLYTCATSRGLVLDLVKDVSAEIFINSLRKFISRRGCPKTIFADNGSAFTSKDTQQFAVKKLINWKFSVAEAPWFGGWWEILVKGVKECLKKALGKTSLRFDELQTLLSEIEATLNSRPLVALYDDVIEEPITPNHLLFGRKLETNSVFSDSQDVFDVISVKRLKYMECILDHFWKRWSGEYLTSLRELQIRRKEGSKFPTINDIVLIKDDKLRRQQWRLGRIVDIIPSNDGCIRAVKLFVGKSRRVIERPVSILYPLEYHQNMQNFVVNDTEKKTKRNAAVIADLKMKLISF